MRALLYIPVTLLLLAAGCNKSEITGAPTSAFSTNIEPGKEAGEKDIIQLTNQSSEGTYFWDFGNGTTSTEKEPAVSYDIHGPYTISLSVTDAKGQTSVSSEKIIVLCKFSGGIHTSTE